MIILQGIIISLVTAFLIWLGKYLISLFHKNNLKLFFGNDITSISEFFLVYAEFILPRLINSIPLPSHPFKKPDIPQSGVSFSITKPVSSCEVRAVKYLAESLYKEGGKTLLLSSDLELKQKLDISYVAFGGPGSNYKTKDIMENQNNYLTQSLT